MLPVGHRNERLQSCSRLLRGRILNENTCYLDGVGSLDESLGFRGRLCLDGSLYDNGGLSLEEVSVER